MNQTDQKKLAIECGVFFDKYGDIVDMDVDQLAAYTAVVEAPLQARIAQLEEGIRLHLLYHENGCGYLSHLMLESSTWLSEHDKEVEAKERERIASKIELMPLAHIGGAEGIAKIVRELK